MEPDILPPAPIAGAAREIAAKLESCLEDPRAKTIQITREEAILIIGLVGGLIAQLEPQPPV